MRNASWPCYDKGTLVGGRSGPRPDKAEIIKLGPAEVLTKLKHVSAVLLGMRGSKCMFLVKSCLRIVSDDVALRSSSDISSAAHHVQKVP